MEKIVLKSFRGRLGNQLFQINTVLQISKALNLVASLPPHTLRTLSYSIPQGRGKIRDLICRTYSDNFHTFKLMNVDFPSLNKFVNDLKFSNKHLVLDSRHLSETFFDLLYVSPSSLIKLNYNFRQEIPLLSECALHFRGTDFHSWNPRAVMQTEYYFEAIDHLDAWKSEIVLFTDDPKHDVVRALKKAIPKLRLDHSENEIQAFGRLSSFSTIIASPSTFSIWAAILGEPSSIVISADWLADMAKIEDQFWSGISLNRNNVLKSVFPI